MPYIKPENRLPIDFYFYDDSDELNIAPIQGMHPDVTVGELNYIISNVIKEYIKAKGKRYQAINDVVGALECAKLELYRRIASPYEDEAIQRNGDIYEDIL